MTTERKKQKIVGFLLLILAAGIAAYGVMDITSEKETLSSSTESPKELPFVKQMNKEEQDKAEKARKSFTSDKYIQVPPMEFGNKEK